MPIISQAFSRFIIAIQAPFRSDDSKIRDEIQSIIMDFHKELQAGGQPELRKAIGVQFAEFGQWLKAADQRIVIHRTRYVRPPMRKFPEMDEKEASKWANPNEIVRLEDLYGENPTVHVWAIDWRSADLRRKYYEVFKAASCLFGKLCYTTPQAHREIFQSSFESLVRSIRQKTPSKVQGRTRAEGKAGTNGLGRRLGKGTVFTGIPVPGGQPSLVPNGTFELKDIAWQRS